MLRWRGLGLTFIAASFWPLTFMVVNLRSIGRPERVLTILAVAWVIGILSVLVMQAIGLRLEVAETTSFILLVCLMSGGAVLRDFGALAYALLLVPAFAGWLISRMKGHWIVAGVVWGMAVALGVGPATALINSLQASSSSEFLDAESLSIRFAAKPDVFVIVFDGYPGLVAADLDALRPGDIDLAPELRAIGFEVPASSWTSYWNTLLSIPSMLEMGYPVVNADWEHSATKRDILRVLSGDNSVMDVIRENGYVTHMVESGWSSLSCGGNFDECIPAPVIDEATYLTLRHTFAWAYLQHEHPGPYAEGTLSTFEWLLTHGGPLSRSDQPDFVFSHVMAPHPPFFLDSDCSFTVTPERGGESMDMQGVPIAVRDALLVEQMDCVDTFMLEFAERMSPEDIVVFVSDHGTDRRHQTRLGSAEWSQDATIERLNNFLAVTLPEECSMGQSVILPNLFRRIFGCLATSNVESIPERMWINPMQELDRGIVMELVRGDPGSG